MINWDMVTLGQQCPICTERLDDAQKIAILTENGEEGINTASRNHGSDVVITSGTRVHVSCQKRFNDKKDIEVKNLEASTASIAKRRA